jgi:hypothetical protein
VLLGRRLSLWDIALVTNTAVWFFTSGLVLFGSFEDVWTDSLYFVRKLLQLFGINVSRPRIHQSGSTASCAGADPSAYLNHPCSLYVFAGDKEEYRPAKSVVTFVTSGLVYRASRLCEHKTRFELELGGQEPNTSRTLLTNLVDHRITAVYVR